MKKTFLSSRKREKQEKKHEVFECKEKSPSFKLFLLQKELEYVRNRIRTAYRWIPLLAIEKPEVKPEKVLLDLREKQSTLENEEEALLKDVIKDKLVFKQPYLNKGNVLLKYGNTLSSALMQSSLSRQSGLTAECPEDYYIHSSVRATEFREYKSEGCEGVNNDSDWNFRRGASESTIIDADSLRFDAYAFPKPGDPFDYPNYIMTAGLLKFNFPEAPCDVVVEWNAHVNIDFILGAIISGEGDGIMIDLVIREQPDSTSFPNVWLDDPGFEWRDWGDLDFYYPDAPNHRRRSKRERLSGQFEVEHGMPSSLIIGPSLFVNSNSEWASIGHFDNPWDDGSFFFHGFGEDCYYGLPCGPQDLSIEYLMRPQ